MRTRINGTALSLVIAMAALPLAACGDDDGSTAPGQRGSFKVRTATTGEQLDSQYVISIDDIQTRAIEANDSTTFDDYVVDTYSVGLAEVAANCTVAPENPRLLTLVADSIVETSFEVTCVETTGVLEVVTVTTGDVTDDEYSLAVDGAVVATIPANGRLRAGYLATGDHSLELGSVAANCVLAGDPERTVAVPSEGTISTRFEVFCTDRVGSLRITTETVGIGDPDGFDVRVQLTDPTSIGYNDTLDVQSLAEGVARVTVLESSVAEPCALEGPNPRSVDIRVGQVSETTLRFDCQALP